MDSFIFSLNATVPIFAVMFLSYVLKRHGFFSDAFIGGADRFVFRVLIPLLLFRDISTGNIHAMFNLRFFLFAFGMTVVMIGVIWIGARLFLREPHMVGAFTQASYRSSVAILGVAFAQNIYGGAGMVPLVILAVVPLYNIAAVVILVLSEAQPIPGKSLARSCTIGILTNPIILGIAAGLPFALLQIHLPVVLSKTVDTLASMASPLALVVIGAGFQRREAVRSLRQSIVASIIKLVILPGVFLPIAYVLGFRGQAMVALLIVLGTPTAVSSYIMAKNMGGDAAMTSNVIVITTAASSVTLTFFIYMLRTCGAI